METMFNFWQSILREAGVITGCDRCANVCPVGADLESMLRGALEHMPEDSKIKQHRLALMRAAKETRQLPAEFQQQER